MALKVGTKFVLVWGVDTCMEKNKYCIINTAEIFLSKINRTQAYLLKALETCYAEGIRSARKTNASRVVLMNSACVCPIP